jgi:hypothetical protein
MIDGENDGIVDGESAFGTLVINRLIDGLLDDPAYGIIAGEKDAIVNRELFVDGVTDGMLDDPANGIINGVSDLTVDRDRLLEEDNLRVLVTSIVTMLFLVAP